MISTNLNRPRVMNCAFLLTDIGALHFYMLIFFRLFPSFF
uniref:Uncharacterized protein n=1 Tax=Rhizophora mucronata TaxID=61149 RepID=A0A2P2LAH5_RHIMU